MTIQNQSEKGAGDRQGRGTLLIVGALILLAAGIAGGYFLLPLLTGEPGEHDHDSGTVYYCPMHPQIRQDKPGVCPICHMDLVPEDSPKGLEGTGLDEPNDMVSLTPRDMVIADVATTEVDYRMMSSGVTASAEAAVNESTHRMVTSWFPGRIERLYIDRTGEYVRKGEPLAEIYSPELATAQKEYLIALDTRRRGLLAGLEESGPDSKPNAPNDRSEGLIRSARQRLVLLGMSDNDIRALEERGEITYTTTIRSTASGIVTNRAVTEGAYVNEGTLLLEVVDLSSIWVFANVYETDVNNIPKGATMTVTGPGLNGAELQGRVDYIYPSVDPATRTVRVRGVFANPNTRLKPGMYLTANVNVDGRDVLAVPKGAVIRTGTRDLVYVEVQENTFEAREVTIGMRDDGYYEIVAGNLKRGDNVVSEGGYLIDSERQLNAGPSGTHDHGNESK